VPLVFFFFLSSLGVSLACWIMLSYHYYWSISGLTLALGLPFTFLALQWFFYTYFLTNFTIALSTYVEVFLVIYPFIRLWFNVSSEVDRVGIRTLSPLCAKVFLLHDFIFSGNRSSITTTNLYKIRYNHVYYSSRRDVVCS